jgi:hypothetical protein
MKRGKIYDWEDFGFDHLTYDEVHNANHIVGKVKLKTEGLLQILEVRTNKLPN